MEGKGESQSRRALWRYLMGGTALLVVLGVGAFMLGSSHVGRSGDISSGVSTFEAETTTTSLVASSVATPTSTPTTEPIPTTTEHPAEPGPESAQPVPPDASKGYAFPVLPPSAASYARSHHDYPAADVFAPCGSEVVAPHAGVVQELSLEDTWSSRTNTPESRGGLSFSIVGDDGVRYYGSHLQSLDPAVTVGVRLETGRRVGTVGDTGNARGSGCHLHFGISTPCGPGDVLRRRGEFWPQEYLDAWAAGEPRSPAGQADPTTC